MLSFKAKWRPVLSALPVGQTVPKAPDRIVPETPEEFRLRAIIVALASGYTLAEETE